MAENAHTTPATTGRRTLLAATLGLAGLPAIAPAEASLDAELIRLAAASRPTTRSSRLSPSRSTRGSAMRR
jgi:hypothetical protein